ncbi:MAG: hypothetical protein FWD61_07025 [Phycisphaerales bacterium]|nr:hypothetical protein [Phycisphaerales bacterium]
MPIDKTTVKPLEQVVHECGRYPLEAFEFVRRGLSHTVEQVHGKRKSHDPDDQSYHVSGQQLCWGLRSYALARYGQMAYAVLLHWNISRTNDFGKIVFAMIESKLMAKTDDDNIHDFHNVYDFATAFNPPTRPHASTQAIFHI